MASDTTKINSRQKPQVSLKAMSLVNLTRKRICYVFVCSPLFKTLTFEIRDRPWLVAAWRLKYCSPAELILLVFDTRAFCCCCSVYFFNIVGFFHPVFTQMWQIIAIHIWNLLKVVCFGFFFFYMSCSVDDERASTYLQLSGCFTGPVFCFSWFSLSLKMFFLLVGRWFRILSGK